MYTSTVQSSSSSANAALPSYPRLQTSYPPVALFCTFSLCLLITVSCSWVSFCASCLLPPDSVSGFCNRMLEVFEPEALNYFTFFSSNLSILSVSRNPILTHPHLVIFGFSALRSDRTLAAVSSFWSGRAYTFLNFLPSFFLHLIPTLIL